MSAWMDISSWRAQSGVTSQRTPLFSLMIYRFIHLPSLDIKMSLPTSASFDLHIKQSFVISFSSLPDVRIPIPQLFHPRYGVVFYATLTEMPNIWQVFVRLDVGQVPPLPYIHTYIHTYIHYIHNIFMQMVSKFSFLLLAGDNFFFSKILQSPKSKYGLLLSYSAQ